MFHSIKGLKTPSTRTPEHKLAEVQRLLQNIMDMLEKIAYAMYRQRHYDDTYNRANKKLGYASQN
jgi:hypothetical protein